MTVGHTNLANENLFSEARQNNKEVFQTIQLSSQELLRLKGNEEFYDISENALKFIDIISGNCEISIRLIDHFITKYSKNNKCSYKLVDVDKDNVFNIYFDYKNQLKHFQKIHFDPFSRGDRIPFFMLNTCIITTIGQLNFFKWFISKKIYDYLLDRKDAVYNDMNQKNKIEKRMLKNIYKQCKKKLKNKQLSESIKKPIILYNNKDNEKKAIKIVVSFD